MATQLQRRLVHAFQRDDEQAVANLLEDGAHPLGLLDPWKHIWTPRLLARIEEARPGELAAYERTRQRGQLGLYDYFYQWTPAWDTLAMCLMSLGVDPFVGERVEGSREGRRVATFALDVLRGFAADDAGTGPWGALLDAMARYFNPNLGERLVYDPIREDGFGWTVRTFRDHAVLAEQETPRGYGLTENELAALQPPIGIVARIDHA